MNKIIVQESVIPIIRKKYMLNWDGINHPMKMREISRTKDKKLWVNNDLLGKSTTIDLIVMAKDSLFCNYWCYIASGSGDQAEQTFMTLEKIANDNIDEFQGSTGKIFKDEVVIANASGNGFSHNPNGFRFETYNGSKTITLNSNIDAKRGENCSKIKI